MAQQEGLESFVPACRKGDRVAQRDLLRYLRRTNLRHPELVSAYGGDLLRSHASWLGDEQWTVREQVLVAALDVDDGGLADECARALMHQFPGGSRTARLEGMLLEAAGDLQGATEVYDDMLKKNEANAVRRPRPGPRAVTNSPLDAQLARKRKVALRLHVGDRAGALKALRAYLEDFPTDTAAWLELAALGEEQGDYEAAKFCYEELLLASPLHAVTHMRYAEALCTLGSPDRCKLARHHFAQSLELQPASNLRAAVGLCTAAHAVATSKGPVARADPERNAALHRLGRHLAKTAYDAAGADPALSRLTMRVLETQGKAVDAAVSAAVARSTASAKPAEAGTLRKRKV